MPKKDENYHILLYHPNYHSIVFFSDTQLNGKTTFFQKINNFFVKIPRINLELSRIENISGVLTEKDITVDNHSLKINIDDDLTVTLDGKLSLGENSNSIYLTDNEFLINSIKMAPKKGYKRRESFGNGLYVLKSKDNKQYAKVYIENWASGKSMKDGVHIRRNNFKIIYYISKDRNLETKDTIFYGSDFFGLNSYPWEK